MVIGATADKYGSYGGRGLRVPPLSFDITGPPGVADPTVTEDLGATVSVNDDAHRRVWFMRVPAEGTYRIVTKGEVNGFVQPRLVFGRTRSLEAPLWVFAGPVTPTSPPARGFDSNS